MVVKRRRAKLAAEKKKREEEEAARRRREEEVRRRKEEEAAEMARREEAVLAMQCAVRCAEARVRASKGSFSFASVQLFCVLCIERVCPLLLSLCFSLFGLCLFG